MKHRKLLLLIVLLLFFILACDITLDVSKLLGSKEQVSLSAIIESPAQGSQVEIQPVDIRYKVTAPEGVANVELNIDGYVTNMYPNPDPTLTVVSLQYSWTPQNVGSHLLRVRVQDTNGDWRDYTDVIITVIDDGTAAEDQAAQQSQPSNTPAATNTPTSTETPSTPYVYDVTHDVNKFYYKNSTCGATKVTITLKVSDPDKVWSVVIFTRFRDHEGEGQTSWDSGHAMTPKGDGLYSITLQSSTIANYDTYEFADFRYQFVATDEDRNEVIRSEVFEDINYEICP